MSPADALWAGTSSWSEKSWVGPFYPPRTKPGDFLAHYATQFRTVEVDATYYRIPSRSMVEGWRKRTPDGFILSGKVPRDIVHGGDGPTPDPGRVLQPDVAADAMRRMCGLWRLLGDRAGPLVLQFPYFNRTVFADQDAFLTRLDPFLGHLPDDLRFAVEVRNKAWLTPALTAVLRKHRVALVMVELPYMPHPADVATRLDIATTDFTYHRLIGDREAIEALTKTFDRVIVDHAESLARWATLLKVLIARIPRNFVYANNHYAGHAPATIRELMRKLLGGEAERRRGGEAERGKGGEEAASASATAPVPEPGTGHPAPDPPPAPKRRGRKPAGGSPAAGQGELF